MQAFRRAAFDCRKEKATIDLCCCGFKCNDADTVKHGHHPATQPAATTGAAPGTLATKPASEYPLARPACRPALATPTCPRDSVGYLRSRVRAFNPTMRLVVMFLQTSRSF